MNLNFYPNDFNQQQYNQAMNPAFNPYATLMGFNANTNLQNIGKGAEDRLKQLQEQLNSNSLTQQNNNQNTQQAQPYYLFCGDKNDWDEFLILHYGITEQNIFEDYKLFLQAKQELLEEQGKSKKDTMKDKIRNKNITNRDNIKNDIKSNVAPKHKFNRQYTKKQHKQTIANTNTVFNRDNNSANMGYSLQSDNRLLEPSESQPKEVNR